MVSNDINERPFLGQYVGEKITGLVVLCAKIPLAIEGCGRSATYPVPSTAGVRISVGAGRGFEGRLARGMIFGLLSGSDELKKRASAVHGLPVRLQACIS
jgi:hypothetical protein